MKILYLTPAITDSGGIARVMSLKANYFASVLDYEVHILTVNNTDSSFFYDFNPKIQWYTIHNATNRLLFLWRYIRFIKETIAQKKPDVIIVCDAVLSVFIPWLIQTKTPIIFETHVSISLKKVNKQSFFSKLRFGIVHFLKQNSFKRFKKIIFETDAGRQEWNFSNAIVIPNPMSFSVEKLAVLDAKKAIAVSRHSHEKGIDRLLMIWKRVLEKHPDWILDIYGQWEANLQYQNKARELQISANINFIAPKTDIQKDYEQSSILLMTSRSEAFGMVLIEAMNCGLPCIAYDCPIGPRTIIENDKNGFLIQDGNVDLFVDKLQLLMDDKNLRLEMGKTAKESVKKYDIDQIMEKWSQLFEEIVANNSN